MFISTLVVVGSTVPASTPCIVGGGTHLATVDDKELLVSHPVIWLHAAVKELGAEIVLDAVGLPTQLELHARHNRACVRTRRQSAAAQQYLLYLLMLVLANPAYTRAYGLTQGIPVWMMQQVPGARQPCTPRMWVRFSQHKLQWLRP